MSGGVRLWRTVGIGVGVSRAAVDVETTVAAQVPHLFFFGRDRSISGTAPLTREETAVHVQVLAVLPVSDAFTVSVFGGPTFFTVTQDLVSDVEFTHRYPLRHGRILRSNDCLGARVEGRVQCRC